MARLRSRPDVELWEDEIYTVSHEGCGEYEVPMSCATATHEIYCPSCVHEDKDENGFHVDQGQDDEDEEDRDL